MSNLIHCETCGKEIAKQAETCPYCGIKRKKRGFFKTALIVFIVFMTLALIGGLMDEDVQANLELAGIPACDSQEGIYLAKDQIETQIIETHLRMSMQGGGTRSDEIIDVHPLGEVSFNEIDKTRVCEGIAEMQYAGQVRITYTIRLLNDGNYHIAIRKM